MWYLIVSIPDLCNLISLCLTDCLDVIISPNNLSMKYTVHFCDSDDVRVNFSWLIQLLNEKSDCNTSNDKFLSEGRAHVNSL